MTKTDQTINIHEGEDRTITATIEDEDGSAVDLTNATVDFYVKSHRGDATKLLTKSTTQSGDDDISITDAANGKIEFAFVPTDTDTYGGQVLFHACEVTLDNGKSYVVWTGDLDVRDK